MRRRVLASVGKSLPYLRRVAYLESHGTERIDTGLVPDYYGIDISFQFTEITAELSTITGIYTYDAGTHYALRLWSNRSKKFAFVYPSHTESRLLQDSDLGVHNFVFRNLKYHFDGEYRGEVTYRAYTRRFSIPNVQLFAQAQYSTSDRRYDISAFSKARIFHANFHDTISDDLIMSLIPVIDLSGRPAMYNEAPSDVPADDPSRFFYNQGSGEFTTDLDVQT